MKVFIHIILLPISFRHAVSAIYVWVTYQGRKVDKDALPAKNTSSVHELCIKLYLVNNLSAVWKKRLDRALSEEGKIHNKVRYGG